VGNAEKIKPLKMYPTLKASNHKLLLVDRLSPQYLTATAVAPEYLRLIIPHAGLYWEQDADFEMLSQHMSLGPFSLWLHDIYTTKDIVLCPYTPFHLWALHFMYEATLRTDGFLTMPFTLEERQCNLFNLYEKMYHVPMNAGKKVLSFHINILPADLPALVHRYPALSSLMNKRLEKVSGAINQFPYRINQVCNYLVQHILSCKYVGEPAKVFLHRCCVDLFLNFAQQDASATDPLMHAGLLQEELYHRILAYLIEHPNHPHTPDSVAAVFDLPPVRLAQGFRQHFSIGIQAFIKMLRMMFIFHLLLQRNTSLQQAAAESGFKSVHVMLGELRQYYDHDMISLMRAV
jgi:AraC-like DNA-binding protein